MKLQGCLQILGADLTNRSVNRTIIAISNYACFNELDRHCNEIDSRLRDELEHALVLVLESRNSTFFDPQTPLFGAEVAAKFPSIAYDVNEAGKCLALDRSIAAVFHSVRCLEAGLSAISACVGIPDPVKGTDRNWGIVLSNIEAEVERRWPKKLIHTGIGEFFREVHSILRAWNNPYRTSTMHLDRVYTEAEARQIFEQVGFFMKKVASRCDESGDPKLP